jgi:tRNA threonylcarbamoyladenosine biosynthesis protein TsaB
VKIKLRAYVPEDFEAIYEIDQACYTPEVAYSRRDLREYLRFPGSECVVAEDSGKPFGFCITARRGGQGYIVTIDVLESHRGKQAGSKLLAESERRLAENGVTEIGLETATDTESVVAFWLKHGYRKRGVKKDYYPGGRDAYVMRKTLGPAARLRKERK